MAGIKDTPLLPGNASELEIALDQSGFDPLRIMEDKADEIRTAKLVDIPDSFLPWLVYEYGLEAVVPWVTDEREAMRTGIRWQRVRGTPESLNIALSWINFQAIQIEEEQTGGRHYFEFQLEIDKVPSSDLVMNLIELSRLSAPVRSRLTRVYNEENDVRRFRLDHSPWGDLLDDYSGAHGPSDTRLSFGRHSGIHVDGAHETSVKVNAGRVYGIHVAPRVYEIDVGRLTTTTIGAEYSGQYWTGVTWRVPETWATLHTNVGVGHSTEQM